MINKFYLFFLFFQILKINIYVLTCNSNKIPNQIQIQKIIASSTTANQRLTKTEIPIIWQNDDWAHGCDFDGKDLIDFKTTGAECGPKCKLNPECTHFTWTTNSGGICWLKYGNISKNDAFQTGDYTMVCGIVRASPSKTPLSIDWQQDNWAFACDFSENTLINIETRADDCGLTCSNHPQCTHFTWKKTKNGTCYLKKGPITKADAFLKTDYSMVCGIVRDYAVTTNATIDWKIDDWAFSCNFSSKNIAISQTPGEKCSSTCYENPNCTHFTWSPANNGTCYLKSGNINKNDAIKIYDNSIVCGIVRSSPVDVQSLIDWQDDNWAFQCDFKNNDLTNNKTITYSCGPICSSTPNCTHFTWTTHDNGTCWLKYGEITKNDAFKTNDTRMMCGIV